METSKVCHECDYHCTNYEDLEFCPDCKYRLSYGNRNFWYSTDDDPDYLMPFCSKSKMPEFIAHDAAESEWKDCDFDVRTEKWVPKISIYADSEGKLHLGTFQCSAEETIVFNVEELNDSE